MSGDSHVETYLIDVSTVLSLDIMDETGVQISEYDHQVSKERLDSSGKSISIEYPEGKWTKISTLHPPINSIV